MEILGRKFFEGKKKEQPLALQLPRPQTEFTGYGNGNYRTLFAWTFNGEKNLGEIGPVRDYRLDYTILSLRSWQSYLESEIAQTILTKFTRWKIGKGLKLQSEPVASVLKSGNIGIDRATFSKAVEERFALYCKSKKSDYAGMFNVNKLQSRADKSSMIGGDVLVILRPSEEQLTVQLVDGSNVINPLYIGVDNINFIDTAKNNGNRIENGIELSPTNEHIAYYVRKGGQNGLNVETTRVRAKDKITGLTMAYLVYGLEYRIDNMRGMPLISAVLETIKKLDRYKEATVGTAEELAKIVYQIVHRPESTGESPLAETIRAAHDVEALRGNNPDLPVDVVGNDLANKVQATTMKQTYNMPIAAELKTINPNKYQLYFKDFYEKNAEAVCSTVGIPPDVAFAKYNSNYSASRAAIKDWEHVLNVAREDFGTQFMQPIFMFWLFIEVSMGRIKAPGLLEAIVADNWMILEAYFNCRWVGAAVPHIDPVKEVTAERLKLGAAGANIPLTTVEAATESLNNGEASANMEQFAEELQLNKTLGIEPPPEETDPSKKKKKPNPSS